MVKLKDLLTEAKGKQIYSMWMGIRKENAKLRADAMNKANIQAEKNIVNQIKIMFREEDDYKAFFKKAMKKFNVSNIQDLSDDDKKDFFNYVDRNIEFFHSFFEECFVVILFSKHHLISFT